MSTKHAHARSCTCSICKPDRIALARSALERIAHECERQGGEFTDAALLVMLGKYARKALEKIK